jgi:hypothetical protein
MPAPKADTSVKRKIRNWRKAAKMTSSPYFKELKDKSNPILDKNRHISQRNNILENVAQNKRTS